MRVLVVLGWIWVGEDAVLEFDVHLHVVLPRETLIAHGTVVGLRSMDGGVMPSIAHALPAHLALVQQADLLEHVAIVLGAGTCREDTTTTTRWLDPGPS